MATVMGMATLSATPTSTSSKISFNLPRSIFLRGFSAPEGFFSSGNFIFPSFSCNRNHYPFHRINHINKYEVSFICSAVKDKNHTDKTHGTGKIAPRKRGRDPILSEGRDDDEKYGHVCPGCGVFMQDKDLNLPGYYQEKKISLETENSEDIDEEDDLLGYDDVDNEEEMEESFDLIENKLDGTDEESDMGEGGDFDWDSDEFESEEEDDDEDVDLDGFRPPEVGYGNITEELVEKENKRRRDMKVSKAEKKRMAREAAKETQEVTVCARCHSLRNYGQVKNETAENLIPDFDFDRLISTRLMKPTGNANSTVVVMVVDCVDFDGSFPKRASRSLFKALEGAQINSKTSKQSPKLVLVATKVDLLPSQISPTRLDRWVRHRAKAGGAPKLHGVYLVSARKDLGMRNLLAFIKELAGPRGNVWVIGAQNAGKSTLINALAKKGGAQIMKLTEAPVAGTTLGILRIGGILSAKAKMYDTPGLIHPYLMSLRLNRDEQKMIELRKELKPRSYRVKVGHALLVGGLMRLDISKASVDTIYVTVWVSPNVSLHMGKIENADETMRNHVGTRLQPPIGETRASELGKLEDREIKVSGTSWDVNSLDIGVAGLGWVSLGLKGEATLTLWTYDGIDVTLRDPLVLDRAPFLERPGFLLPKAISEAIGSKSKLEALKKLQEEENDESLSQSSVLKV